MLEKLPQVEVKDGIWSLSILHCIIAIHTKNVKSKRLKIKERCKEVEEVLDGMMTLKNKMRKKYPTETQNQDKVEALISKKGL